MATGIGAVTKIKKVKDILTGLRNFTKNQWDDLGRRFGDDLANGRSSIFKAGDNIAGKIIVQVKQGSNGKIAIIGRKMDGHVNDVVSNLQNQGKQVEAFNNLFQANKTFDIDGVTYTWQKIVDDFENTNGQYPTNALNRITDDALPNTLMYKANQKWAQKLIDEGYEVIDIGYPINEQTSSLFYEMELSLIFP